jgi:hypothetical protein
MEFSLRLNPRRKISSTHPLASSVEILLLGKSLVYPLEVQVARLGQLLACPLEVHRKLLMPFHLEALAQVNLECPLEACRQNLQMVLPLEAARQELATPTKNR